MTHEEEAAKIVGRCELPPCQEGCHRCGISKAISTALRKRDELYDAAWRECKQRRGPRFSVVEIEDATNAHDTLRREAGKEKA